MVRLQHWQQNSTQKKISQRRTLFLRIGLFRSPALACAGNRPQAVTSRQATAASRPPAGIYRNH
jgi:hypothetical protein